MDKEIKQNTKSIQDRFPEVYRKFFSENETVVSSDFSYNMTGGLSWRVGAPIIKHKLPFRSYVGIHQNDEIGSIKIGSISYFNVQKNMFYEPEYEALDWEKTIPHLKKFLEKKTGNAECKGITLNFLTERPEDRGLDTSTSVGVLSCLYLFFDLLDVKRLQKLSSLRHKDIVQTNTQQSKDFQEMLIESMKIISLSYGGNVSGCTAFASLIDSYYPIVHFTQERAGSVEKKFEDLPPCDVSRNVDVLENLHWWGFGLNELEDISGDFPLEVVIVFPGSTRVQYSASEHANRVLVPSFDDLRDFTRDLFSMISYKEGRKKIAFLGNTQQDGGYWHEWARGQMYTKLYLLRSLIRLYKNKLSSSVIHDFLETMNATQGINQPFEEQPSKNIQFILRSIIARAEEKGIQIDARSLHWGKQDGNIFIYSPPKKFRSEIYEIIEKLQQTYDPSIGIDFVSWRDGWGHDGLRVEQHIKNDTWSPFLDKNNMKLRSIQNKKIDIVIVSQDDVDTASFDLLIDVPNNEIYIGGKIFTSNKIPSKKATIELLTFLAERPGGLWKNSQLPESGYAKYRNELQGKIITPLDRLLTEYAGKTLGVKVTGELRSFFVQFEPKDLTFGILEHV